MTKQPSYRFTDYDEPWAEKKLGEVADFTKGKGYSKGDLEMSGIPIILYGRLYTNYQTIIDDVDTYVTMKEHSVLSEGNEIIVPSSGESSEEISRASVVAKNGVILGGDLNIIKLNATFSSVFVAITLSNGAQQKELSKRAQGKSVVHLHNSDLKEVNLSFPSLPEQVAIGSFFQDIDQLISLQQRKLEVLKGQKKTYLKLLFPAKGQTKPALRFAGFEDEWTSVLLGDISELYQPKTISSEDLLTEGFPVFGANGYIGYYRDYNHKENQVTISARGEGTGTPSFVEGPVWITGNSMVVNVEKQDNITKPFLYAFCLSFDFKPFVTGGAQPQLTREVLKKVKIMLPSLPEQESIGSFFQDLDKAIAKQEERVNQLKESKQTLLRKMFI